mmetsp:Transcript_160700/g.293539  ORF Transcript_160700/g.293539 Transcript_160700/m.293539 type:complete len:176 (-) Transcript_160700:155-682(-)
MADPAVEVADGEEFDGPDIFYVCKRSLEELREKIKKGEELERAAVDSLAFPESLADDEIMTPVDMRGVGKEFDDVEQMIESLGSKGTVEAFVKAKDYFDKEKDKMPEEDRPNEMTAKEWRTVLAEEDDGLLEGEEEDLMEDFEEEFMEGEEEEDGADEEEKVEPPPKKAKTVTTD